MASLFLSDDWVVAYKEVINGDATYKKAGATWDKGVVVLVCKADPAIGIHEDAAIWLDLHHGVCRDARMTNLEEANEAPFCITANYDRWKQVLRGTLDPIKGIMQGKLRLRGNLASVVRYVAASKALVKCAANVPTEFADE